MQWFLTILNQSTINNNSEINYINGIKYYEI